MVTQRCFGVVIVVLQWLIDHRISSTEKKIDNPLRPCFINIDQKLWVWRTEAQLEL